MRNYHDKQGLGDLPAEKLDQTALGRNISLNYLRKHRKYESHVRTTINPDDLNALQPDVIFYRKDPNHKEGVKELVACLCHGFNQLIGFINITF